MKDFEAALARWVEAGLVNEEQARAIRAAEGAEAEEPEAGTSLAATALGYLGAAVALVGGMVAASREWADLTTGSRLSLAGGATLLLLGAGWLARRRQHPALRSLDGFLWFLAAGGAAFTGGLVGHDVLELETRRVFLVVGLATAALGFPLWRIRPGPLQEIAVVAGLAVVVEALLHHLPGPPDELHGLPLWGLGAIWALLAWGGILRGGRSSLALAGVALLLGPQILSFGWRGAGLALGMATAVLLLSASVRLGSMLPLGFGAAGVLLFLPQIVFEYLGDSLGAPLALLVCGVALLGAAFLTAWLRSGVRQAGRRDASGGRTRSRAAVAAAGTSLAVGVHPRSRGRDGRPRLPPRRRPMRLPARAVTSAWAVARGVAWVHRRRELHRPLGQPLAGDTLEALAPHFRADLMEAIRVHRVPRIRAPWPVGLLGRLGRAPINFGHVWGITYLDTIVLATSLVEEDRETECLFHECVHAAQVRQLGPVGFVRRYVEEWAAAGWRYRGIGLEREAYALQRRFEAGEAFLVEAEVERNFGAETTQ
ncbi:MAG: DUF2157 domain-containing protein [Gemmatimonadota bacterium]